MCPPRLRYNLFYLDYPIANALRKFFGTGIHALLLSYFMPVDAYDAIHFFLLCSFALMQKNQKNRYLSAMGFLLNTY